MKKIMLLLISIIMISGCTYRVNIKNNRNLKYTEHGTYKIVNLVKNRQHSSINKVFYTLEKDKNKKLPDNISVNEGINYYTKEEHLKFKTAIQRQLYMQISKNDNLTASAFTTKNKNMVYKFIINNEKARSTQYYIVGDKKFVLVYVTNFTKEKEIEKEALYIVNTFKWKKER